MIFPSTIRKYFLYLTLFISGAVILVIEIAGVRVLAPFYGSTIFVWSSLITITLGFLALGYFVGGFIADKYPKGSWFYFIIFLGGAASLLLIKLNQPLLVFSDQFGLRTGPLVAALIIFAIPLFLLSMAGPFAIRLRSRLLEHTGHVSGTIFGVSTVGSLVGALLVGFYFIPNFLLSNIFTTAATLIMIITLVGLFLEGSSWGLIILSLLVLLTVLLMPFIKYEGDTKVSIIHQEPSFYADLKVGEIGGNRCLFMDGALQTCILSGGGLSARYLMEIKRLSEAWPQDSKILVLGLGGGSIFSALDRGFSVDVVEIDPKIKKLAKEYFGFKLDGNDTLVVDDARLFLRKTDEKYDVIISDLYFGNTMPTHLYTKEVSELYKSHLTQRGVVITNISGSFKEEDNLVVSLIRTQQEVFPYTFITIPKRENPKGFENILVHAFMDTNYKPSFDGQYVIQQLDTSKGKIVVDSRNSLDILLIENLGQFLKDSKEIFGLQPLFSI